MDWQAEFSREEIRRLRLERLFDKIRRAVCEVLPLSEEEVYRMVYPSPAKRAILIYADFEGVLMLPDGLVDRKRATGEILKRLEAFGVSWELEYDHGQFFYTITSG
jgi:hypothetical protein